MENSMQGIAPENREKWETLGHEPVRERGVVRLREFKKTLPADLVVTHYSKEVGQYVPYILKASLKPLLCGKVLPERADLALDDQGRVLPQGDFEMRYKQYLEAFVYPEGAEPLWEPIPNVMDYVCETQDTFSESSGYIEIEFDPKIHDEFNPTQLYGLDGETEEEWRRNNNKRDDSVLERLLAVLEGKVSPKEVEEAAAAEGIALIDPGEGSEPIPEPIAAAKPMEFAPCGSEVRQGYVNSHKRFCKAPECVGEAA